MVNIKMDLNETLDEYAYLIIYVGLLFPGILLFGKFGFDEMIMNVSYGFALVGVYCFNKFYLNKQTPPPVIPQPMPKPNMPSEEWKMENGIPQKVYTPTTPGRRE